MNMLEQLNSLSAVIIQQRFEMAELFGFETRNKYSIETETGQNIGFVAEQQKGVLGFLMRQFLGHWKRLDFLFFDSDRRPLLRGHHPFRWFFQRLELRTEPEGQFIGAIQSRFAFFHKRFDVEGSLGEILLTVSSPIWRIWTFPFMRGEREVARIEKKWSGIMTEAFTDKDRFRVAFPNEELTPSERQLVLAAGIFIDLQYFEVKAQSTLSTSN